MPTSPTRRRAARRSMASLADRHALYELSVQDVTTEISFVDDTYRPLRGRRTRVLREDFCGTAGAACEWVRRRPANRAIAVDLDAEVLDWGQTHNVAPLGAAAKRLRLVREDVLKVKCEPADVVLAMNFSYWIFEERKRMRDYFRRVRRALADGGLLMLDAYGGHDAFKVMRERTVHEGFTYTWDQADYDPISGRMQCHIHFSFPDRSRIRRAFSYRWRLWTLPELIELLTEAGFARSTVYWQGTDEETGEGNGEFAPAERGDPDPAWIAYIVAER